MHRTKHSSQVYACILWELHWCFGPVLELLCTAAEFPDLLCNGTDCVLSIHWHIVFPSFGDCSVCVLVIESISEAVAGGRDSLPAHIRRSARQTPEDSTSSEDSSP
jgi:hypothetical protein